MSARAGVQGDENQVEGSGSLKHARAGEQVSLEAPRQTIPEPKQRRRNDRRQRVLKGAHITFKGRGAVIDCTVRNLSDRGACLKVESPIGIPDVFDLVLDQASVRNCRVAWRKATQIGVEFADPFSD